MQRSRIRTLRPETMLALGFLALIALGAGLLMLPLSCAQRQGLTVMEAVFTSASSVCVTGLSLFAPGERLSVFGQAVQLFLIQLGGLGFMTFATLLMTVFGRRMSLRGRLALQESMNQHTMRDVARLSVRFLGMALAMEAGGALLLMPRFVPLFGARGVWYSVFTAVSAFCNAGIDVFTGAGMAVFRQESYVLMVLCLLTLLGGMGFPVLAECLRKGFQWRRYTLHAKLVLVSGGLLLMLGTAATLALEWTNPLTLGALPLWHRVINSLFHSVMLRSTGFAVLEQGSLTQASRLLSMPLMMIGAASASTGGGVKVTTAAVLFLSVSAVIRGRERVTVFEREIPADTIRRALAVVLIALACVVASACVISVLEAGSGFDMLDILYETTAALSTTGMSSLGTQNLSMPSVWLLIPLMYLGRLGPLTLALALAARMEGAPESKTRFPQEKIMIG